MQAICRRELPIPDHVDMFLVSREMAASNDSALKVLPFHLLNSASLISQSFSIFRLSVMLMR